MFTFLLYLLLPFCLGIPNLPGHSFDYKQLNNGKVKIKFNGTQTVLTRSKVHMSLTLQGYDFRRKTLTTDGKR